MWVDWKLNNVNLFQGFSTQFLHHFTINIQVSLHLTHSGLASFPKGWMYLLIETRKSFKELCRCAISTVCWCQSQWDASSSNQHTPNHFALRYSPSSQLVTQRSLTFQRLTAQRESHNSKTTREGLSYCQNNPLQSTVVAPASCPSPIPLIPPIKTFYPFLWTFSSSASIPHYFTINGKIFSYLTKSPILR